ncbi:MAG: hypothetical protein JO199_10645 [Candidatus Eremiobacteraeota bacterium]|nr:hypothetical protein [Candidatus Eremiobacteraeota bacterium]
MAPQRERLLATLVIVSPLLGIPVWLWLWAANENRYDVYAIMFFPGPFLLAAGLLVALVARVCSRSAYLRGRARESLRFQAIVAGAAVAVAFGLVGFLVSHSALDVFMAAFAAFGVVLTVVELGRIALSLLTLPRS